MSTVKRNLNSDMTKDSSDVSTKIISTHCIMDTKAQKVLQFPKNIGIYYMEMI